MVGTCSKCGSPTFTKEERNEQAKLAREIVEKIKREKSQKELPKCYKKVLNGEDWEVDFCCADPECHFCDEPYTCGIPHYLRHLLLINHNEDEQ